MNEEHIVDTCSNCGTKCTPCIYIALCKECWDNELKWYKITKNLTILIPERRLFIVAKRDDDGYITEQEDFFTLKEAQDCIESFQEYREFFSGETYFILQVLEERTIS